MAKRYSQTQDTFSRGMLQRESPRAQDAGYLNEAVNVQCIGGAVQSRPGMRPFNGVAFSGVVRGMGFHIAADGSSELLVAAGAALQRCSIGGDPINIPLTNLPLYAQTRTEQEKVNFLALSGGANLTFIYDGVNHNVKWDGTNLSFMGLPNGPTPVDPVQAPGAVTKGTRKWVITLVSPYHEGDISVVERTVTTTTSKQFTFASPVQTPDAVGSAASIAAAAAINEYDDPQVTKWRLWRTVDAGAAYFFVGEADIGVDITDNVTDEVLLGNDPVEQLVNGPPQSRITAMVEHRGQLVAVMADQPSILRFSNFDPDYMVPEGWPRPYVQPVAVGDGDIVNALRSFHEFCVIFKDNSSHALVGDEFNSYKIVPLVAGGTRQGIGCAFPSAILQVDNEVFFASRDGIYRVSREGGLTADRITRSIDKLYAAANFSLGSATFYDRKRKVFGFLGHG